VTSSLAVLEASCDTGKTNASDKIMFEIRKKEKEWK